MAPRLRHKLHEPGIIPCNHKFWFESDDVEKARPRFVEPVPVLSEGGAVIGTKCALCDEPLSSTAPPKLKVPRPLPEQMMHPLLNKKPT